MERRRCLCARTCGVLGAFPLGGTQVGAAQGWPLWLGSWKPLVREPRGNCALERPKYPPLGRISVFPSKGTQGNPTFILECNGLLSICLVYWLYLKCLGRGLDHGQSCLDNCRASKWIHQVLMGCPLEFSTCWAWQTHKEIWVSFLRSSEVWFKKQHLPPAGQGVFWSLRNKDAEQRALNLASGSWGLVAPDLAKSLSFCEPYFFTCESQRMVTCQSHLLCRGLLKSTNEHKEALGEWNHHALWGIIFSTLTLGGKS